MKRYNAQAKNDFPSKGAFYSAQRKIGETVKAYANKSMQNARMEMKDGAQRSGDGRYPSISTDYPNLPEKNKEEINMVQMMITRVKHTNELNK